jgi:plastocyanin
MADWLVNIVIGASGQAQFVVGLPGAKQGQPLKADQDDLVCWNNETNDTHQLWETDSNYDPVGQSSLPGAVKPGMSSDNYDCAQPTWQPASWTIYYYCSLHPQNILERGSIQVAALPQRSINITGSVTGTAFSPKSLSGQSGWAINWYNGTNQAHQPWQTDQNYKPLTQSTLANVIQPSTSSLVYTLNPPSGNPPGWTVYYYCKLHPNAQNERGTIVIPPPGG